MNYILTKDQIADWEPIEGLVAIYMYLFDNGKVYIGQTKRKIYERYRDHVKYDKDTYPVKRAIYSHAHSVVILCIVDEDEADEREKYYIAAFDAKIGNKGYNVCDGGEGVTMTLETRKKISQANSGEKNGMYGSHRQPSSEALEKSRLQRMKPIRCRETGVIYESLTDACKQTGATLGKINMCALGLMDTTGGYTWEYVDEEAIREFNIFQRSYSKYLNSIITREKYQETLRENGRRNQVKASNARKKPVRCRETGVIYPSLKEACDQTGATRGKIDLCAMGILDTTGGYTWEYIGLEAIREFNIFSRQVAKYVKKNRG